MREGPHAQRGQVGGQGEVRFAPQDVQPGLGVAREGPVERHGHHGPQAHAGHDVPAVRQRRRDACRAQECHPLPVQARLDLFAILGKAAYTLAGRCTVSTGTRGERQRVA